MTKELFATSRPLTMVYAFILTIVGFRFYQPVSWLLTIVTAFAFAGITGHIMTFNDFIDREHDRKKGKTFVSDHPGETLRYKFTLLGLTGLFVGYASSKSLSVAGFCVAVWAVGVLYSFIPRWYIVNNLVVGICSGAPALVGMAYIHVFDAKPLLLFLALVFIILTREVYKDMEDVDMDRGYKETIPGRQGHPAATIHLTFYTIGWTLCLAIYGSCFQPQLLMFVFPAGALVTFSYGLLFTRPARVVYTKKILDWAVQVLLVIILIVQ